jgi:hypothetical protein
MRKVELRRNTPGSGIRNEAHRLNQSNPHAPSELRHILRNRMDVVITEQPRADHASPAMVFR